MKVTTEKKWNIVLVCACMVVFLPHIFNIYYSMPANDDFALSLNWWGKGIIGEAFMRAGWNYMNWFGQSGILAILIQVLFNPLYWFNNVGHSMGICMLIVNCLVMTCILKSIYDILKVLIDTANRIWIDLSIIVIAIIISSAYYYSDVYNWWSGFIGYAIMMMFAVLSLANTVMYNASHYKKNYIGQIVFGVCACTSLMCCAPVGLMYLVITALFWKKNVDTRKRRILPFALYVISGIITAAAPGNFTRKIEGEGTTVVSAIKVSIIVVVKRLVLTFVEKPWMLFLLLMLVAFGITSKSYGKYSIRTIIVVLFGILFSAVGTILPYVYGQAKDVDTEFAPRAYYMMDYVLFIGLGITAVLIGICISAYANEKLKKISIYCVASIGLLALVYSILTGNIKQNIQYDIVSKSDVIKESYEVWNGILDEIDSAEAGSDVVITRPQLTWCQYVYYPGINEEVCEPIKPEDGYANCNQSAAKHYGVNRVSVIFE